MHNGDSPFNCLQCGESFRAKSELTQHTKMHNPEKPLLCGECGSCFNTREALALHVRLHTGDKALVNDLCMLNASLQHTQQFQTQNGQVTTATLTQQTHQSVINNTQTTSNSNISKPKPHVCPHCGKAFAAKHGLLQHNKRHPDGGCTIRTHICETCNKAFFQKNHLMLHQRQHGEQHARNAATTTSSVIISQQDAQAQQQRMQAQQQAQAVAQVVVHHQVQHVAQQVQVVTTQNQVVNNAQS